MEGRVGVVMIAYNRPVEALRGLGLSLPTRPRVVACETGPSDGRPRSTARRYVE